MPDPYTYPSKPTDLTYTTISASGREQYDDANITYDQSTTYYDGINENAYTALAKPTGTPYTSITKPTT